MPTTRIELETFETRAIAEAKGAYEAIIRVAANRRGLFSSQLNLTPDLTAFLVPGENPPTLPSTQVPERQPEPA